ncbi:histidine--tRNA ligase, cytoplasmic [Nymphaea colorata]|nr:histidine--tRNA ligase, cytoplasmic [Nymphaea colorata]
MERRRSAVNVGGKGSVLSPESVFAVANSIASLRVDPSLAQKPSQSEPPSGPSSSREAPTLNLTPEETRATIAVFVNKLILSNFSSKFRPSLAISLADAINGDREVEIAPDFSRVVVGDGVEFGISAKEFEAAEGAASASFAVAALIEHSAASLCPVVDAVAAMSCEVSAVDGKVFDLPVSSEGLGSREVTDVAADMKRIVFGSKLLGSLKEIAFSSIPYMHGSLRGAVKALRLKVRVETNSAERKFSGYMFSEADLVNSVLPLTNLLRNLGGNSLARAKTCIETLKDDELRVRMMEAVSRKCPTMECLKERVKRILEVSADESKGALILHDIYVLLKQTREIVAWEAAVAVLVLRVRERALANAANEPGEKEKNEKKKKGSSEMVVGKGTAAIRLVIGQVIESRLRCENGNVDGKVNDADTQVAEWASEICSLFDPKDPELTALLDTVKGIVESNEVRRLPKIPKGTRDFGKEQMAIREKAFSIIVGVFKRHGGVALDTPAFELRETLMGKYGEDSKLIYDLADQGGEICSLRYDLTVPFARYLAMNGINNMRRYQIAKVYRRDNPSKGRYREFYQCDFDIAGQYPLMQPDFEVIKIVTELLDELNIGNYEIKLNHRRLLDGMLEICGVPPEKFRTVCSSIDKLDKQTFEQVQKELVDEKGLSRETTDMIGSLVKKRGHPQQILAELKKEGSPFLGNCSSVLDELEILFTALEKSRCINRVVFDLSLARGLDYYTGVIYEAVFKGSTQVGSIAAGGRYDNLVGMFSGKPVPAVGVSLGIERVFTIMEQMEKEQKEIRAAQTQIMVVVSGDKLGSLDVAAEIVSELWSANLKAEFVLTSDKNIGKQFGLADKSGIPWVLMVGKNELQNGVAKLKDMQAMKEEIVPRSEVVKVLSSRLLTFQCSSSNVVV